MHRSVRFQGEPIGCPLSIYRIKVDVRWNQDAARNIAAANAKTQWLLLTDMDHIVSVAAWKRVLETKLYKTLVYRFSRTTLEPDLKETKYKPHPNSWLMTRAMYDLGVRAFGYSNDHNLLKAAAVQAVKDYGDPTTW